MAAEKGGEFRGKTVEAAIGNGLTALGVAREQVEVEVVRPGSRGLLGIGAEDAVVHLTVITGARPELAERGEAKPEGGERRPEAATAPRPERGEPLAPPSAQFRPESRQGSRSRSTPRSQPAAMAESQPVEAGAAEAPAKAPETAKATALSAGDAAERGREVLEHLLGYMNLRGQVEVVEDADADEAAGEKGVVLNVVGDDLGVLIGRQSEVLSALQFLTRLMANQQSRGRVNLIVDVNGYKAKRTESLRKLALRTAEQVTQTGRTMALEPMPPAERRIVHITLRNHPHVSTQSVGEGSKRKVTVVAKKPQ